MRPPPSVVVADAAILIAAARGKTSGAIVAASRHATLATTDRALTEARRKIELGIKRPDLLPALDRLGRAINVSPVSMFDPGVVLDAQAALRDGPASRNESVDDAHLLTLAWGLDADLWSTDRDFAGVGVAWSTPNLMRAFARTMADRNEHGSV